MGGRVAEQLSKQYTLLRDNVMIDRRPVYGAENVTSGASSDIRHATRVARNMVKVRRYSFGQRHVHSTVCVRIGDFQSLVPCTTAIEMTP